MLFAKNKLSSDLISLSLPYPRSSHGFATPTGSVLPPLLHGFQPAQDKLVRFRVALTQLKKRGKFCGDKKWSFEISYEQAMPCGSSLLTDLSCGLQPLKRDMSENGLLALVDCSNPP